MAAKYIRWLVILAALSFIGILSAQIYWIQKSYDIHEREFHQSVQIALNEVAADLANYNETQNPISNKVRKISTNYFIVQTNDIIDANVLEFYLKLAFYKHGILTDYEYGIYDCSTEKMVYGNYISAQNQVNYTLGENLPKWDEFIYYFGVRFPKVRTYVMGLVELWLFFSIVLFILILFFSYALFALLRQKKLSQVQKDFVNNMTHEFKTPVATIRIAAKTIQERALSPEKLHKYAKVIQDENQRISQQVDKVLQMAKLEDKNIILNLKSIDVNDTLKSLIESYNIQLTETGKSPINFQAAEDYKIEADLTHFTNIIDNLIDNAIKYSPDDQKDINIKVEKKTAKKISINISDKGFGIPKNEQKAIFDQFYRVNTGDRHNIKGFGIGLFYVKKVCDAHKWIIKLKTAEGKGSSFEIIIPTA